ncbi:hypothetical protein CR513_28516, partial [Mucuna pruriens]
SPFVVGSSEILNHSPEVMDTSVIAYLDFPMNNLRRVAFACLGVQILKLVSQLLQSSACLKKLFSFCRVSVSEIKLALKYFSLF